MRIDISNHAADRYVARVKPHLGRGTAKQEIARLLGFGEFSQSCSWHPNVDGCDGYMVLSDGIALGLKRGRTKWLAVTCLIRGEMAPEFRASRNHEKASRRRAKRARNRKVFNRRSGRPEERL